MLGGGGLTKSTEVFSEGVWVLHKVSLPSRNVKSQILSRVFECLSIWETMKQKAFHLKKSKVLIGLPFKSNLVVS